MDTFPRKLASKASTRNVLDCGRFILSWRSCQACSRGKVLLACIRLKRYLKKVGEMDLGSATNIFFAMETDPSQPMLELTHNQDRTEPYDKGDGYAHVAFTVKGLEEK